MSIYAISDLHLSFGSEKPMDIFKGWEGYVLKLKNNWENLVKNEDTVIIAGDISWAMRLEETKLDFQFINDFPGKKIILKGNHDYWWSTAVKIETFFKKNKFDTISLLHNSAIPVESCCICGTKGWFSRTRTAEDKKILLREAGRLERSLNIAKGLSLKPIVFLHYPPVYGLNESKEIMNVLIEKNVKKCYYGHIHGIDATKKVMLGNYKGISFQLVSCDYINFCPILVG